MCCSEESLEQKLEQKLELKLELTLELICFFYHFAYENSRRESCGTVNHLLVMAISRLGFLEGKSDISFRTVVFMFFCDCSGR